MTDIEEIDRIAQTNAIGVAADKLPTDRSSPDSGDSPDPDDEQIPTPADIELVLGFDPAKEEL